MDKKQQTVVEFLIDALIKNKLMALRYDSDNTLNEIIQEAAKLEKANLMDSFFFGGVDCIHENEWSRKQFEHYYNKYYKKQNK